MFSIVRVCCCAFDVVLDSSSPTEGFRNSSLDEGKGYSEPTILEPKYSEPYSVNSAASDSETVA